MHKIIHPEFEIDLSNIDISFTDDNDWFSDAFTTKYSFPFSVELTDDMQLLFSDLLDYRIVETVNEYEVIYVFNDSQQLAILTAEGVTDTISFQLKIGIEEFPNFSKKLAELELETKTVTDIYAHAKTVVSQSWPAVNYNFPQVHTDKIDNSIAMWTHFERVINNYKQGDFVTNQVIDDVPYNRNLMQPLPYFLHVLTQGFAQAGYELKGDVLSIDSLKKKLVYFETDYHNILNQAMITTAIMGVDKTYSQGNRAEFFKTIALPQGGRYQVVGTINIYGRWKEPALAVFKYRNKVLWYHFKFERKHHSNYMYSYDVDFIFDTINDGGIQQITFESSQFNDNNNFIADFTVSSLFFYNDLGVAIPNVVNNNKIELNRVVPDVTFGTFVTAIKNWYNLDIDLRGKQIWMDFIEDKINYFDALDLSNYETKPERNFNKGASFLLKFVDPNDEINKHQEMFFNISGYSSTGFVKDDKTNEIIIQAFPLRNEFKNGIQTAYAFEADKSKIYSVLYDGLNDFGLNLTDDLAPILLPQIAERYYKNWFNFRLQAVNFKWVFTAFSEALSGLTSRRKVFAYGRYFVSKTVIKRQISKDLFDVEIDGYTLK
jgi:hypothetical protein